MPAAKQQTRAIAAIARQADKAKEFADLLKRAVHLMQTDPHGWGDPEFRSSSVDGLVCHGILRPVVFRYVIYDQVQGVVLLSVQLFTEFVST